MPALLPPEPPISPTNRVMNDVPDDYWGQVLSALGASMPLPSGPWRRLPKGKNVVIELGDEAILKLIPPCWAEDAQREAVALMTVPSGAPVATPTLLASGTLEGWTALLVRRLPGAALSEWWPLLEGSQRAGLAAQLGAVAAWLHHLEVPPESPLAYDWETHIAAEARAAPRQLAKDGAPGALQDSWPAFLRSVGPLPSPGSSRVLLHGDLSAANVLVGNQGGRWRITGLLDFGDASLGEATHDWLSPGAHDFAGDPVVVSAFCDGYGLHASERTPALQAHLLARTLLYYGWRYLAQKFPLRGATTWNQVASIVWPLTP